MIIIFLLNILNLEIFLFTVFLYFFIITIGSIFICFNFYAKSVCHFSRNINKIAITFDDVPNEITLKVLDLLDKYNIKANFFCVGKQIESNKDIFLKIFEKGHLIANHSYSHSNLFGFFSTKKVIREILQTQELIYKLTKTRNFYFRPPFGVMNPNIAKAVRKLKYKIIAWDVRSFDTMYNVPKVLKIVENKVKNGSIILFHNKNENILLILEHTLKYAFEKNFKIVRIDEMD